VALGREVEQLVGQVGEVEGHAQSVVARASGSPPGDEAGVRGE
jgi:hypothetical protein